MLWMVPSMVSATGACLFLLFVYGYLYQKQKESYLGIWTIGWGLYFLRFCFMFFIVLNYQSKILIIGNQLSTLISGFFLVWGIYIFMGKKIPKIYLYITGIDILWIITGVYFDFSFLLLTMPTFLFMGFINIAMGALFIKNAHGKKHFKLLGFAFILWGIHKLDYPFLQPIPAFAPWGYTIGTILSFIVAVGMLILYFERMRDELSDSETKYRSMMEALEDLVVITSHDCKIQYANPAIIKKIGRDLTGEYCCGNILNTDGSCKHYSDKTSEQDKNLPHEVTLYDGSIYHLLISPLFHGDGSVSNIHIFRDISHLKNIENELRTTLEHLKYLSFHDKLTGLFNRPFFEEELKRLNTPRQLPMSLILIDLNALKLTNDAFGHGEGDRLLKITGRILRDCCRDEDIVARIGGDEFAIILPNTHEVDALKIVSRIKKSCANVNVELIQPSVSMGVGTKTEPHQKMDQIFKIAEDRMYRNKLKEGKNIRNSIILSILKVLRERSHESESHAMRTEKLALQLGKIMDLSHRELDELALLSVLHDIGKIGIPEQILKKSSPLNDKEWEIMKKHCEMGYHIAKSSPELGIISDAILHHHERWDGKGYPQGIRGKEIPLLARIIGVVDAYDVMTHDRPYRNALSHNEAIEELKKCGGTQFDSEVVNVFVKMMENEKGSPL